jgi:hypothetical protein
MMAVDPRVKDAEARVAAGVKWLDKNQKDWVEKFTKNGLKHGFDLRQPDVCVLGNIFYASMREGYFVAINKYPEIDPVKMGFNSYNPDNHYEDFYPYNDESDEWKHLAEAWQGEILYRQCKQRDKAFFAKVMKMLFDKKY